MHRGFFPVVFAANSSNPCISTRRYEESVGRDIGLYAGGNSHCSLI